MAQQRNHLRKVNEYIQKLTIFRLDTVLAQKHRLHVYEMHSITADRPPVMATPFYKRRVYSLCYDFIIFLANIFISNSK